MRYWQLTELFDKLENYQITSSTPDGFSAEFLSIGRVIKFDAVAEIHDNSQWSILFGAHSPDSSVEYQLTNAGNSLRVMGTIQSIIGEFFKIHKPTVVRFSSLLDEPSRISLYHRMAVKSTPEGYHLTWKTVYGEMMWEFRKT